MHLCGEGEREGRGHLFRGGVGLRGCAGALGATFAAKSRILCKDIPTLAHLARFFQALPWRLRLIRMEIRISRHGNLGHVCDGLESTVPILPSYHYEDTSMQDHIVAPDPGGFDVNDDNDAQADSLCIRCTTRYGCSRVEREKALQSANKSAP